MNNKRRSQIEELATFQLQDTGFYPIVPNVLVDRCLSVDVDNVVKARGIELVPYDFGDDIAGVLLFDGKKATIGYSEFIGTNRKRFTVAHELGHYVLNHQRRGLFVDTPDKYFPPKFRDKLSSTGENLQEREANAFAAALLMPEKLIVEVIDKIMEQKHHLAENYNLSDMLAKYFEVSPQAMFFRLYNLNIFE